MYNYLFSWKMYKTFPSIFWSICGKPQMQIIAMEKPHPPPSPLPSPLLLTPFSPVDEGEIQIIGWRFLKVFWWPRARSPGHRWACRWMVSHFFSLLSTKILWSSPSLPINYLAFCLFKVFFKKLLKLGNYLIFQKF